MRNLPLSSNPEFVALPPLGTALTPEQDAALFSGDIRGAARRVFQGLTDSHRLAAQHIHSATPDAGVLEKAHANAR